jgi:hypothetical protein
MRSFLGVAAMLASLVARAADAPAASSCDRACLKGFVDQYLDALARHDPSGLPVAASLKFTENGNVLKLGEGFWKTAGPAGYRLYAIDPANGDAAADAVVAEHGEPAIVLVRLKVGDRKIKEVETIVCRKGHAGFFSPGKLKTPPAIYAAAIPPSERASREQLEAAANAYFTAVQTEGSKDYKAAPLASDMNRFENGEQTTNVPVMGQPAMSGAEQLDKGIFRNLTLTDRRFPVIDRENGVVLGVFVMHAAPDEILIAEMFKVAGGKIHQVQAVMVNQPPGRSTGWN